LSLIENPSWGEGRIADELSLKLGLFVDSRTLGKYLKQGGRPRHPTGQRWATFIHNHANAIVACDFFTSVTATFQVLYVFVVIEIGSRRILHCNVTNHPTAEWTRQQFREFLDGESSHRYLIHDRDSVFSVEVDAAVRGFGLRVLKTPVRSPMAKDYVSHCTSSKHCGTNLSDCIRWESFMPCAFLGASWPGGS